VRSERFKSVRIEYSTLLHERGIYYPKHRAKTIIARANLAFSTLMFVKIMAKKS
jgi:hypothetical protein